MDRVCFATNDLRLGVFHGFSACFPAITILKNPEMDGLATRYPSDMDKFRLTIPSRKLKLQSRKHRGRSGGRKYTQPLCGSSAETLVHNQNHDGMRREHTPEDGSSRKLHGSASHRTPHRGSQNPSRGSMAEALAEENDREWELTGIVRGF